MRLPKSWTHRKVFVRHANGDWSCYCGHPRNEHYQYGLGCATYGCRCKSPLYPYTWEKK